MKKRSIPTAVLTMIVSSLIPISANSAEKIIDFENLPEGRRPADWTIWKSENIGKVAVDAAGYNSKQALKLSGVKAAAAQYDVAVKPGDVIAFDVLCRQEGSGNSSFTVVALDKDGAVNLAAGNYSGRFRAFDGAWRRAGIRALVPAGAASLRVILGAEKQQSANDVVWFDDVRITREISRSVRAAVPHEKAPEVKVQVSAEDYQLQSSNREALNTMRIGILRHGDEEGSAAIKDVTPGQAADYARKMRETGYNIVLTEGQRYLMSDTREHAPFADVMQGSLPFADLVKNTKAIADACHAEGLKVYLHLTAGLTSTETVSQHPDRMAVSVNDGKPKTVWGLEWMCLNNPGLQAEYFKRLEKLVAQTKADGLMVDETSMMMDNCGCQHCRTKFSAETGMQLPPQGAPWFGDLSSPIYRAFLEWRLRLCVDYNQKILEVLRKHNPDAELISYYALPYNPTAWRDHGYSLEIAGATSRPLGLEMISNYSKYWALFVANMKFVRSVAEHSDGDIFTISNPPDYEGIYQHWLMSLSQGAHKYWSWYIPESLKEERAPLVQWEMKNESLLAGLKAAADTAVVISTRNNNLHRDPVGSVKLQNSYFAIANTLTMAQVPYKTMGDLDLEKPLTGKAQTIIALNLGLVSDEQAENLTQFVKSGGTLITSTDFSLYDENGEKRENFALADLLGCDFVSKEKSAGILSVTESNALLGGVTGDFESPDAVVSVKPHGGTQVLGTITLDNKTSIPGILLHPFGKGRVVYFAGHIEPLVYFNELNGTQIVQRSYGEDRDEKFETLFLSLVRTCSHEDVTISNLPKGVLLETYTHNFKGAPGFVVSLLNFTGMLRDGRPEMQSLRYPDISSKLPDSSQPIRISWNGAATKAFAISPDFEGRQELELVRDDRGVSVEIPIFGNFLMVFFE